MTFVLSDAAGTLALNMVNFGHPVTGAVLAAIELEIKEGNLLIAPPKVAPVQADPEVIKVTFVKPQETDTVSPPSRVRSDS